MAEDIRGILEQLDKRLYDHNEQQLRAYIAAVNLQHSFNRVPLRQGEKIRIHFAYLTDVCWPVWASFYQACRDDDRMETKLVFCNSEELKLSGRPADRAEDFLQKNALPYTEYASYNPFEERPHILVYQLPYNPNYLALAKLRANYLKQAGVRPVYIPYGIEYDLPRTNPDLGDERLNLLHYRQYVQLFAWKIIVMHKDIQESFFRHCLAGGAHTAVLGNPKFDAYMGDNPPVLPEYLRQKAAGRPIVVWQLHHFWSDFNDAAVDPTRTHSLPFAETRRIASWLQEQRRVFTIVTLHPLFAPDAVKSGQARPEQIEELRASIRQSPNTALHEGPYQPLLAGADAFITEKSSLMLEMALLGKPILLLQDLEAVLKPFAADIASSFYHGKSLDDVREFFRIITGEKEDALAEARKRVRDTYYARCDGRVGERIKDYLAQCLLEEQQAGPPYA